MKFTTRRGRPCLNKPAKDRGTTELQNKRMQHLTTEPIDLCLARGLITPEQHNASIRLRWLYTLRMGAPTISAYSPEKNNGKSCKLEDEGWSARKQAEYEKMLHLLEKAGARRLVVNTCIFGHIPAFLYDKPHHLKIKNLSTTRELELLKDGLDVITNMKNKAGNSI